jgi:transposase InsO family protein
MNPQNPQSALQQSETQQEVRARLRWVRLYEQTGHAGLTCRRCGISRPTLRKWWRRYQAEGELGLHSRSRRPHRSPNIKITPERENQILSLRRERRFGPRRLRNELQRQEKYSLSSATIWKVLHRNSVPPIRPCRRPQQLKRYSCLVPGERVQMDTCKIGKNLYQFTAIDDCTRWRVLGLYSRRTAKNAAHFLSERVVEEMPFAIQRIQTDRGGEFFGTPFQLALQEENIKFRPNRPGAPHLNGKVERSQQTDKVEFWPTVDCSAPFSELEQELGLWQTHYNWERSHGALGDRAPLARWLELMDQTPFRWQVCEQFDEARLPLRIRDYKLDLRLRQLKRCP